MDSLLLSLLAAISQQVIQSGGNIRLNYNHEDSFLAKVGCEG